MADKEFNIHLRTTGDPKGAREVERAIDGAADAAKSLGSSSNVGADGFERNLRESAAAAQSTERAVESLERSLEQLNEEIVKNNSLTDDQVTNLKRVTSGGERLVKIQREQRTATEAGAKSTHNYGLAALEASRAIEDMQYGIAGVLNNLPNLVLMLGGSAGLTAVLSIAAVAGAQLWKHFVTGPEEAKKATEDWVESLDKARRVFQDMEAFSLESQGKRIAERARSLADALSGIDYENRRGAGDDRIEAKRIEGERLVALAQNRLEITRTEAALVTSSGQEAVRLAERLKELAKERSAIEIATLERRRDLEVKAAERELQSTQKRSEEIKQKESAAEQERNQVVAAQEELYEQANRLTKERFNLVDAMREEIAALRQEIDDIDKRDKYHLSPTAAADAIDQLEAKIEAKFRIIDSSNTPSSYESNSYAAADAMQKRVDKADAELNAVSEQQKEASRAMRDAALALVQLEDSQEVERGTEQQVRSTDQESEAIKKQQEAQRTGADAVSKVLGDILAGIGDAANRPDVQSKAQEVRKLLADGLQSSEGDQIQTLITQIISTLNASDARRIGMMQKMLEAVNSGVSRDEQLASAIQQLKGAVDDANRRIGQLETNITNIRSR